MVSLSNHEPRLRERPSFDRLRMSGKLQTAKVLQKFMPPPKLSIVMPVYNEAEGLAQVIEEIHDKIARRLNEIELIAVDDASTDQTPQILRGLADKFSHLKVIRQAQNQGHGPSIRAGFTAAQGEWVLQIDSDGQMDPDDFWKLYEHAHDYDGIFGIRQNRRDPAYRRITSAFIRLFLRLYLGAGLRDANCPLKLIRRKALMEVLKGIDEKAFAPSIFLAAAMALGPYRIRELPVSHRSRQFGHGTLPGLKFFKVCRRGLRELIEHRNRWQRPQP